VETPDGKKKTATVERNIRFEDSTVFGEETRKEIQVEVPVQPKTGSDQRNSTLSDVQRTSKLSNTSNPSSTS
jgi:hypothetical protein